MLCKWPAYNDKVRCIFRHYQAAGYIGTYRSEDHLQQLKVAPPPGSPERACWTPVTPPLGSIGLLLCSAHAYAVAIDSDFNLLQANATSIGILSTPWQYLKGCVRDLIDAARCKFVCYQRSILDANTNLDIGITRKLLAKCPDESFNQLQYRLTLSSWTKLKWDEVGRPEGDGQCHCGAHLPGPLHTVWQCSTHKAIGDDDITKAIVDLDVPTAILIGHAIDLDANPEAFCKTSQDTDIPLHKVAAIFKCKQPPGHHYDGARMAYMKIQNNPRLADLTAKQVAAFIKGPFSTPQPDDPEKCNEHRRTMRTVFQMVVSSTRMKYASDLEVQASGGPNVT